MAFILTLFTSLCVHCDHENMPPINHAQKVCTVLYGHTYSKKKEYNMDQPQSCTWSAEQGKLMFPCRRSRLRIWSRETGSTVPSRVSLLISILSGGMWCLRDSFRIQRRRPFIYLKPAICHRVSPEFIGSRKCVPMAFTAESPPAQGQ